MFSQILAIALLAGSPEEAIEEEIFDFDPASVDISDAINCRLDAPTYNGFAMHLNEDVQGQLGWKMIENTNSFMLEFELPSAINVTDTRTTDHIAFTSTGVMAVLDLEDPNEIAKEVGIENQVDTDASIAALISEMQKLVGEKQAKGSGPKVSEAIPEPVFRKFLGQKILIDETDAPSDDESWRARTIISLNVSNVSSHPGKTLYGCSYKMEFLDKDGKPL